MDQFFIVFYSTFIGVAKIGIIVFAAGFLIRKKIIKEEYTKALSDCVVFVFLPCMIFSNFVEKLDPSIHTIWWKIPLISLAMAIMGLSISFLAYARDLKTQKNFIAIACLQNAGYIILPIGQVLVPESFDLFAVYVFLYILAHNPIIWSIGNHLTTSGQHTEFSWKRLITVPLIGNLLGIFCVITGLRNLLPSPLLDAIHLLGTATVPVATFVLGGSLGTVHFTRKLFEWPSAKALIIKLIIIPAIVVFILPFTSIPQHFPILALMLVLQAASTPATSIILQIKTYGGDLERAQNTLISAYILCLFTIPFWVSVWKLSQPTLSQ